MRGLYLAALTANPYGARTKDLDLALAAEPSEGGPYVVPDLRVTCAQVDIRLLVWLLECVLVVDDKRRRSATDPIGFEPAVRDASTFHLTACNAHIQRLMVIEHARTHLQKTNRPL
jgi:hypothetical protein